MKKRLRLKNNRISWIDSIKGITIISVVLAHACGSLFYSGMFDNAYTRGINTICDVFVMPTFFMTSGYVFYHAYIDWKKNEIRRERYMMQVTNLSMIYVLYSLIQIFVKAVFASEVTTKVSMIDVFQIPIRAIQEYWYIYVMVLIYLMMYILIKFSEKVTIVILMISSLSYACFRMNTYFTVVLIFYYTFFFYMGYLYSKKKYCLWIENELLIAMQVFIVAIYIYIRIFEKDCGVLKCISGFFAANILFFSFKRLDCALGQRNCHPLSNIGIYSFEIYLLHYYITSGARPVLRLLHIDNWFIAMTLLTTFGILCPIFLSISLKKIGIWDCCFKPFQWIKNL